MKSKIFLSLCFAFLVFQTKAQILNPVKENFKASKNEVKIGEELELIFQFNIDKDWYLYSSELKVEGPLPTSVKLTPHASYQIIGKIRPINPKKKYDETWEGEIAYFEKKAEFRQTIKVLQKNLKIVGEAEYTVCSLVTGQCLPPKTIDFDFNTIKVLAAATEEKKNENPDEKAENNETQNEDTSAVENDSNEASTNKTNEEKTTESTVKENAKNAEILADYEKENKSEQADSLLAFFGLAFLAGFVALLTPCVFPMIPMTVTFFTKNKKKKTDGLSEEEIRKMERAFRNEAIRKALFYGISIVAIYTLLGTGVAWINGPAFANWLSTHWIPNLFFFTISIVFGISFLGAFEIVLPSSWVNKADQEADKGGYYGIFFMAFTLALVSFSCTGPIVGSILVQSAGGAILKPVLGMFAFSLAIALPFTLFAVFPTWLNSLPKSGGWLNNVKVVLGFLEIALAFKFLSIPDQTYHWGILNRDVFLALWITIFALIGFYLMGTFRMPHDSPSEKTTVTKALMAMFSFAFVIYMFPGMFGASLKPLAGYLPPQSTIDFDLNNKNLVQMASNQNNLPNVKYSDLLHLPHGLQGFFDFEEGLAYAKKVNKPIFIDFTGHGCVNCREMEARVWSDKSILQRLNNDYVVIALYVDDKTQLPENEWVKSKYDQKFKKTIGAKNADFQITQFNNNAQPFYCLLDHEGKLLIKPKAYDLNVDNFGKFLDAGKEKFKQQLIAKN